VRSGRDRTNVGTARHATRRTLRPGRRTTTSLTHLPYAVDPTAAVAQAPGVAGCPVSAATSGMAVPLTGARL
jgi:hypothetical protein